MMSTLVFFLWALTAVAPPVQPFLQKTCLKCHGPDKQKGGLRIDTLAADFNDPKAAELWGKVLDQLDAGEMPPEDEPRPTKAAVARTVAWINQGLARTSQRQVLRRLNAAEYRNTVRDLFGIDTTLFNPAESFPGDGADHGFDTVGQDLVTSDFLLEQYLAAADRVMDKVVKPGPAPRSTKRVFSAASFRDDNTETMRTPEHIDMVSRYQTGRVFLTDLTQGVGHDGEYVIRITAAAINRTGHPYSVAELDVDPTEPARLNVFLGTEARGKLDRPQPEEQLAARLDIADGEPRVYEIRTWMDADATPMLMYHNGPLRTAKLYKVVANHLPASDGDKKRKVDFRADRSTRALYLGPRLRVFSVEIEGPIAASWPPPAHVRVFGAQPPRKLDVGYATEVLTRLARRAYRRPVTAQEMKPIAALVGRKLGQGLGFHDAIRFGLKAILCSPKFLYLRERGNEGTLDQHELAARLSYFLWSTMPDDELLAAADRGELANRETLIAQTRRMLADSKVDGFVTNFVGQWLRLRRLNEMPPDRTKFEMYYYDVLDQNMAQESYLFFRHLLEQNLSIANFLDSDFTFANKRLARLYGIDGVSGDAFTKVALKPEHRRGGILGQASVLTVTANGIETSPVVRGVWVLENVFGRPPSPPPANVKALEPDIRGATTVRDQLEKHRSVEACQSCHRKIDPYGFALENFDPVGAFRARYDSKRPIEAGATTPDGHTFKDIVELKQILVAQKDDFARCLTEKLMVYATGRPLARGDRPAIAELIAQAKERGYGLHDLVLQIVESRAFQTK